MRTLLKAATIAGISYLIGWAFASALPAAANPMVPPESPLAEILIVEAKGAEAQLVRVQAEVPVLHRGETLGSLQLAQQGRLNALQVLGATADADLAAATLLAPYGMGWLTSPTQKAEMVRLLLIGIRGFVGQSDPYDDAVVATLYSALLLVNNWPGSGPAIPTT